MKFSSWWLPGFIALCVLLLLTGLPLLALLRSAADISLQGIFDSSYHKRVIWFSFYQACLSTLLATLLAIPVARALSREQHFRGRQLIIQLFSLSLVIPTIVAISGIVVGPCGNFARTRIF